MSKNKVEKKASIVEAVPEVENECIVEVEIPTFTVKPQGFQTPIYLKEFNETHKSLHGDVTPLVPKLKEWGCVQRQLLASGEHIWLIPMTKEDDLINAIEVVNCTVS